MKRDELIELTASAFRSRDAAGRVRSAPAWHDLDDADRQQAFERAAVNRALESAIDPDGLSATARAVLARIERSGT